MTCAHDIRYYCGSIVSTKDSRVSSTTTRNYLALALRLHADKIQHTQAHEAFAALEPAYSRARDAAADAAASTPWTGVS